MTEADRLLVPNKLAKNELDAAIDKAASALLKQQKADGHFVFELEADVSISAEYILLKHYFGTPAPAEIETKIGRYLRRQQRAGDGWPLYWDGPFNISSSVKAYFALKAIGDSADAPHMQRARSAILNHGGAASSNVFTRALLALFGAVPWRAVPVMPVEIMHLPRWFPFHLSKISYWGRTVLVPLMVVNTIKLKAENPRNIGVEELFPQPPDKIKHWPASPLHAFPFTEIFAVLDAILRRTERFFPKGPRKSAIDKALAFVDERLNGVDGLGAIYPAMAYSALMFRALGVPDSDHRMKLIFESIDRLLIVGDDEAFCQPCVSPVWDTGLTCHSLIEAGIDRYAANVQAGLDWLRPRQVTEVKGDWASQSPDVRPGGWAFQYSNPYYPDLDDTAVVVMALDRAAGRAPGSQPAQDKTIVRAREWILGLQSKNGGFGAFDADNDRQYLNYIPFADHGALLDPPTADVTARCLSMLAQLGDTRENSEAIKRATDYLLREQKSDGSWYGRWGINYIYGTWSVLCALNAQKFDPTSLAIQKAVAWLKSIQNSDGGWGEDPESYDFNYVGLKPAPSTASQTAWALLGLMAAGQKTDSSVAKGIDYLLKTQGMDGFWQEECFTATGFPRVFYLRYHGYAKFFPLWALARFRNLAKSGDCSTPAGM